MNPTRNLIPSLLNQHYDPHFYGPGYQSKRILDKGVKSYIDDHGPFELICSNEHVMVFYPEAARNFLKRYVPVFQRSFCANFSLEQKHLEDMYSYFKSADPERKVLFLLEFDYYWISNQRLDLIRELDAFIVGFGEQFITPKNEMKHVKRESFYSLVNDRWYDFVKDSRRVIQLTHFLDYSEFYWGGIEGRKYECSVPGASYWSRKVADTHLKDQNMKRPRNYYKKIFNILNGMGVRVFSSDLLLSIYQETFNKMIKDSRYAYTCGSALKYPIRKFFEIPSKGTLLIALPFKNFEHLGFVDKENCLVAEPDDICSVIRTLNADFERAQVIAERGRKMVYDNHSISSRSEQLRLAFDAILTSTFNGSCWENGKFIVKEKMRAFPIV